jgi:hypothetical protein
MQGKGVPRAEGRRTRPLAAPSGSLPQLWPSGRAGPPGDLLLGRVQGAGVQATSQGAGPGPEDGAGGDEVTIGALDADAAAVLGGRLTLTVCYIVGTVAWPLTLLVISG